MYENTYFQASKALLFFDQRESRKKTHNREKMLSAGFKAMLEAINDTDVVPAPPDLNEKFLRTNLPTAAPSAGNFAQARSVCS